MAEVNVTNTLVVADATRQAPYFDDYNEEKNFYKILFRPGYAVQGRELTQLQTMQQVQTERFGRHVFKNGSIVYGGQVSFDKATTINLEFQHSGTDIDVDNFVGKTVLYATGNTRIQAEVIAGSNSTATDPPIIQVKYLSGEEFPAGCEIKVDGEEIYANTNALAGFATTGQTAQVADGVFFISGYFVRTGAQTIVLSKYNQNANAKIGLELSDDIVTEGADASLLDPAQETGNFQAPGAARYRLDLTLAKRALTSTDDERFIELLRVENGDRIKQNKYPIYSELEETFARRTEDESGSYTVRPFRIQFKDDTVNTSNIIVRLDAGKAYIRGYEFETISPTEISIPRPRVTNNVQGYDVSTAYGNYIIAANTKGFFDYSTMILADIHCVPYAQTVNGNTATYSQSKVGTLRVRSIDYETAANTQLGNTYTYRFYVSDTRFAALNSNAAAATVNSIRLYDGSAKFSQVNTAYTGVYVRITSGTGAGQVRSILSYDGQAKNCVVANAWTTTPDVTSNVSLEFSFKDAESIVVATAGSSYTANANIDQASKVGATPTGDAFIAETNYQSLLFYIPNRFVANTGFNNYAYRSYLGTFTFTAGVTGSIAPSSGQAYVGTGALSDSIKRDSFIVIPKTVSSGTNVAIGHPMSFDTAQGRSITVTAGSVVLNAGLPGDTFSADIIADIQINTGSGIVPKKKTLVTANTLYTQTAAGDGNFMAASGSNTSVFLASGQVLIQQPGRTPGVLESLFIADGKAIKAIYDLAGAAWSPNLSLAALNDIQSKYTYDNGQRDSFYDHAGIKLKAGVSLPVGSILVCMDYYTHGASAGGDSTGFFSVDSYPSFDTVAGYSNVTTYTPESDTPVRLGDVIDFRPKRTNASNTSPGFTLEGLRLPIPNEEFTLNYNYYLPRKDLVVLSRNREFSVVLGTSAEKAYPPNDPDDAMVLYRLSHPPFVVDLRDIATRFVENKRYTMRDIGKLETRIQNMEYYVNLNILEKAANDLIIRDSNGLERTKYGIIADAFVGHQIGDVRNIDYACSMDFTAGQLRCLNKKTSHTLEYKTGDANARRNGTVVTLNYVEENFIVQNTASKAENLNPYMIARFIGNVELVPDSDVWIDTDRKPDIVANLSGNNDAWDQLADAINATTANQTEWNDWQTHVTGTSTSSTYVNTLSGVSSTDPAFVNNRSIPGNATGPVVQKTTTTTQGTSTRTGIQQQVGFETITESLGDKVIDVSIIPFIRARSVLFQVSNLRPRRQVWYFFDETPVLNFVQKPNFIRLRDGKKFTDKTGINESVSYGTGNVAQVLVSRPSDSNTSQTLLKVANTRGQFVVGGTLTGLTSGNTAIIDSVNHFSGTANGGNSSTVTLQMGSNQANTEYVGNTIHLVAGSGVGQNSTITAYDYQSRNVTVSPAFTTPPTSNTKYSIGTHVTSHEGILVGTFFIPSTDTVKFRTGDRMFRIIDRHDNDTDNATARADGRYTAQGLRQTKEAISVSVTVPKITFQEITETKAINSTVTTQTQVRHDPLAQTFFVNEDQYPNGVFLTSVEVFFRTKSATMPVWVQIRPTVNGFPHSYVVLPFSHTIKYPDEVNISENPSAGNNATKTVFTFYNPVYLPPGEHALILQSDSLDYEAFVSELGKKQIGTDRIISEQPYMGSLFKSQNASTWTPFQFEDLMFVINKAAFTVGSATIWFDTQPPAANVAMDWMFVQTNALVLSNTSMAYQYKVTGNDGVFDTSFTPFVSDANFRHAARKQVTITPGSMNLMATLSTTSRDVSPVVDLTRYNLLAIENIINSGNLSNDMIVISNGGLAYSNIINTAVTITGGTVGSTANAKVAANSSGNVTSVILDLLGSGYVDRATVTITGGAGSGAVVNIASELDSQGGPARARYITRKVVLTDGFDAGDLRTYVTAYRPLGTEIYVYYRVMNADDPDRFEDKQYRRMTLVTSQNRRSADEADVIEYEFRPSTNSNTVIYQSGPTTFRSFNQYAIKIVMLADDTITIPLIKDMRTIALPGTE